MSKHLLRMSASVLALLVFCLVTGATPARAQSTTQGAIGGTVKDPQGAVVANASVTVRNEETNKEVSATTDDEGRFRVVQLDPGNYTVSVSSSGLPPSPSSRSSSRSAASRRSTSTSASPARRRPSR